MGYTLSLRILGKTRRDFSLNLLKIFIIGFVSFSLLGNIEPYYEGKDSYVHALASINLSNGIMEITNPLLQETGRGEFAGGRWLITDFNTAIPRLPGIGIAVFGAISYILGGHYGLFYLTPIFTIILLIITERISTNLFGKYVGLFTLLLLGTSNLVFRNSTTLQTETIFSVFFILGCFYFIKFFRDKNDFYLLLSSFFFVISTAFRLQGIITFPVEIIVVAGYFLFKKIQEKHISNLQNSNNQIILMKKKTIIKISIFMLIPWIIFFATYMSFYDYYFGDPFTNYGEVQEFQSYETSIDSLFTFKNEDFENIKQYSKYLLPYQIPATYNKIDNNFDNILSDNWIGVIALFILFFSLLISFRQKNYRIELITFMLLIILTVWFYASITTEERAASGVPGRYMIPVFILSSMIFGFLLSEFFKKDFKNYESVLKMVKVSVFMVLCIFFVMSFYFSNPIQILLEDGFDFKNPENFASRYPLDMEGITSNSVIYAIHTDWAHDYGVIPFQPNPIKQKESSEVLLKILNDGYNVYTFKKSTYVGEKDTLRLLLANYNIGLKDYSTTFCKMVINVNDSFQSDQSCLK